MLQIGLNPYGIAYSVGLLGAGTPCENPRPLGLDGFLNLADLIDAAGVELPIALLKDVPQSELKNLKARLHQNGRYAILMHGISWGEMDRAFEYAGRFGFKTIRMHLTSVLCGARGTLGENGDGWRRLFAEARAQFREFAHAAGDLGISVTLEDHQDLTSGELIEICEECGPHVGVCLDTGNPFAVGEDPVAFAEKVAPFVRHVHLKDYQIFWDDEGYRLARCAIGSGAVDFEAIAKVLEANGPLPASIEPGALGERYIKVLTEEWWQGYPECDDAEFDRRLMSARFNAQTDGADWRTPWDKGASADALCRYEIDQLMQSVVNLQELGLMSSQ